MLFKEVGKTSAIAAGWFPALIPDGAFWFCFVVFMYIILKKIGRKAENSEGLLNSLVLERFAKLAMHLESLWLEVEVLRKQEEPVRGEQQGSGLVSETRNLLHDARGQETRLEELPLCPAPHTFTARCPELLRETRGQEEQETVQGKWVRV